LLISNFRRFGYFEFNSVAYYSCFFFSFVSLVTVPGIILHLKYCQIEKGRSFVLNKSSIEFYKEDKMDKVVFNKIDKVEIHTLAWSYKLPWSGYGFTRIILKDGTRYLYTSLTLDCFSSALLFKRANINVEEIEEFWTWPRKN
jgi:hypothetical protein